MRAHYLRIACLGLSLCLGAALASTAGAQSPERVSPDGRIHGRVIEDDGTLLPGVIVLLSGPGAQGAQQLTRADADARFRFTSLAAGGYTLAVELPGLRVPTDLLVDVAEGEAVQVDLEVSLFAYEANVSVVARQEQEDVFAADSTAGLRQLGNRSLTRLPLPAEQAVEVLPIFPGVVRGPNGLISVGGALPTDSAYLLNGADMIDTYSGAYNLNVPLEAVQGIQFYSGVYAAAYGENLGGVVDLTTLPGGADWEFEIGSILPRTWWRDGRLQGVRRFNPRVRLSGPVIAERLRMSLAAEYRFNRERVWDTPEGRGDNIPTSGWDGLAQFDWTPSRAHDVRFVFFARPHSIDRFGLGGLTPEETTSTLDTDVGAVTVDHQYRLDERSFVQTLVSWNRTGFASRSVQPVATEPLFVIPEGFRGRAFHGEDRRVRHWQLKSAYTRAIGEAAPQHVLQFGVDLHSLRYSGESRNDPIEIRGADDRLIRRTEFVDAGLVRASKWEASVFAQDRWRPSSRFWIDAGLRLTWDGATGGGRLAPRLGAAWAPFRNERTLLKASAGVLYRRVFFGEQIWASQPTRIETSFADDGAVWVDEVVPRRGRELDAPRAILSEVQLSHRFSETLSARVRYAKRDTRKQLIFDRVAGPDGETSLLLTNDGSAFHDELELTANVRVGQRGQLFVSYVRSRGEGDINTFGLVAGESPEAVLRPNERGPLAASTPNRLIGWGVFDLPWAIELAPVIEWRSGFPYSVLEEDQSYAGPPNAARFPHYLRADINITKGFGAFGRRFRAGLQVINLTARYNPRQVIANRASTRFGEFLNSEGLRLRLRFSAAFF